MPTLAGLDGASLVPNTLDLLTRGAQAGQDFASRALTPDLVQRVQAGDQQALAELSQLNPLALKNLFAAQSTQGNLQAEQLTQQVTQGRAEALETKGNLTSIMAGGAEGLRNNISKFVAKRGDTLTPEETREIVDIANLATTDPEAAFAQLQDSLAGVDNDISIADQILRPSATGQAGFSAKTVAYNNGVSVQFDNRGNRRVTDASGQVVTGQDAATAIKSGVDAGISEQASRAGSRAAAVADVELATVESIETKKEVGKLKAQFKLKPLVEAAVTEAVGAAKAIVDANAENRSNSIALSMYDTAMGGLTTALGGTVTGPVAGWMPAVTTNQQVAEGAIAAMAPILKQLFRGAGEGTFTDKDQELLVAMLPTRKDTPEARVIKIQNIDAIVRAKLGATAGQPQGAADVDLTTLSNDELLQLKAQQGK